MNSLEKLRLPNLGAPVLSAAYVLAEAEMECAEGYCVLDYHLESCLKRVADDVTLPIDYRTRALGFLCRMG